MRTTIKSDLSSTERPTAPVVGTPFLDAFRVEHGPPGLLGRFFLHINDVMTDAGVRLEFATFEEVAETQRANSDNWAFMNPMFDPSMADLPKHSTFCLVGREASGRIVGTCSGKLFDARLRSFAEIVNSGDFFSLREADNPKKIGTTITARAASTMHGRLGYSGGLWIHPRYRSKRHPAIYCRLVNACMLTMWNCDFILGAVRSEATGTDYHKRYGYTHDAPWFELFENATKVQQAMLLWMSATDAAEDLGHFLEIAWPQINATVIARGRQQSA